MTLDRLRIELGFSRSDWQTLCEAAVDCHMTTRQYIRLMLLAAAGMGGAVEHLDRVVAASLESSFDAEGAR